MGGPVCGGKVYGEWPGLDEDNLHEQRDLAVTTDFRTVISGVLSRHMKLENSQLAWSSRGAAGRKSTIFSAPSCSRGRPGFLLYQGKTGIFAEAV